MGVALGFMPNEPGRLHLKTHGVAHLSASPACPAGAVGRFARRTGGRDRQAGYDATCVPSGVGLLVDFCHESM